MYKNYGKVTYADNLKPWLFIIAKTTLIDYYRQAHRRYSTSLDTIEEHRQFTAENDVINETDMRVDIENILLSMGIIDAQMLLLVHQGHYSIEEARTILGLSTYGSGKSRAFNARKRFIARYRRQEQELAAI